MKTLFLALLLTISTHAQSIIAPIMDVSPRSTFTVPIEVDEISNLFAFQLNIAFDRKVMTPYGYNPCEPGELTEGFSITCNVVNGVVRIAGYAGYPVTGSGPIVVVTFKAKKQGCGELKLSEVRAWVIPFAEMKTQAEDGLVCVVE